MKRYSCGGNFSLPAQERFQQAENLLKSGKTSEAIQAFKQLRGEFPRTWIDRSARKRLEELKSQ